MAGKLKLIEITSRAWEPRWEPLKECVRNELNLDLQTEIKTVDSPGLALAIGEVFDSDADLCRIGDEFCTEVLPYLPQATHKSLFAGACPFLMKEKGGWWPRPLLDEAFTRSVSACLGQVDVNSWGLVAGASGAAKLIVASMASIGFETINVADKNENLAQSFVADMKKKYFRVRFNAVPYQAITTLPGVHSLVVNTTPLTLENDLLDELYFFNFLKAGGVVVDLTLVPAETPLILEARQWGARHLSGDLVAAERDACMLEKAVGRKFDLEKYKIALRKQVDAVPFDPGPFLQRFRDRGM